ncbi:GGDEF domain-containing protein [Desulfovibrio sp. OttesenSCG-928-F20]|nr:GGDEF domain-containing protein [Desulfovibrio sp. OttesenSCG-928-F20]
MEDERNLCNCIWAENGQFCSTLHSASVPVDAKWPLLILYLRGARDLVFLSEVQKSSLQELLLRLLKDKDYSDKRFDQAQSKIFEILTVPLADKLTEIARETSALAQDMQTLLGKHKRNVDSVASKVDTSLAKGEDPATLLSKMRDALKNVVAKMEEDASNLASLSHKDSLTGLANRRSFDEFLDESINLWLKSKMPLALIMFDIDNFKTFNDSYGHLVGDQVLRTLAVQIEKVLAPLDKSRGVSLGARYGGEEFAIILRDNLASRAVGIGELVRKTLQKTSLLLRNANGEVLQSGLRVTVSVGVSHMWEGWQGVYHTNLVDAADKALYHAKRNGKNCTVYFDPTQKNGYILAPND